jgi:hypothetical protein
MCTKKAATHGSVFPRSTVKPSNQQPTKENTMSKTFKDSRTFRAFVKEQTPTKATTRAYKRSKTKDAMRLERTWKSGIEHRLGRDD